MEVLTGDTLAEALLFCSQQENVSVCVVLDNMRNTKELVEILWREIELGNLPGWVDMGLASLPALSFLHTRSARGGEIINTLQIPFWERYTLTIQEASQYFRIGETKLRKIVSENKDADFVLWNGTRPQIKRTKFERFVDQLNLI